MNGDQLAFRLGRRPVLDGVRAVAILAVLVAHYNLSGHVQLLTRGGLLGVDVFFVLSGFLITSILIEEFADHQRIRLRAFYIRRALRLFPALFAMVAVTLVGSTLSPGMPGGGRLAVHDLGREAFSVLTYWDNWFRAFQVGPPTPLSHAWSLAIEEQFYLVWPLLLVVALRFAGRRAAFGVAVGGTAASCILRAVEWHGPLSYDRVYFGSETRASDLLIGCALAIALSLGLSKLAVRSLRLLLIPSLVVCAALLTDANFGASYMYRYGFAVFALATAVVLGNLVLGRVRLLTSALEWQPMVYIGLISYGLYLWLRPVEWFLLAHVSLGVTAAVGLPLTFGLAAVSFVVVERRFLRLKQRFSMRELRASREFPAPGPRPSRA